MGEQRYSIKKKAEILVRAENEGVVPAAQLYGVSKRSIFQWRKDMQESEELQKEFHREMNRYENDLCAPTQLAYKQYLALASNLAMKGDWRPGKVREVQEMIKTLGDMAVTLKALMDDEDEL